MAECFFILNLTNFQGKNYAYWSSDIKDYGMIEAEELYRPGGFCNMGDDVHFFALTTTNMLLDSITICPPAFTDKAEKWETIDQGLVAAAASPASTELHDTSPRSLTLFHELIHMTSTVELTPDSGSTSTIFSDKKSQLTGSQQSLPSV